MGFSGSFVLARVADVAELDWIEGEPFETTKLATRTGTWLSLQYDDEDPYWVRDETLTGLVEQTRQPALVALCLDSDFLAIAGQRPGGARWDGAVYADVAQDYREEGLQEGYDVVVPTFMALDHGVAGAVAWADSAGLLADEIALARILSATEWTQPADAFWGEILDALGFVEG